MKGVIRNEMMPISKKASQFEKMLRSINSTTGQVLDRGAKVAPAA